MGRFIFVPVGSYEQHGPHLPPDTDFLIANELARKVASNKEDIIEGIKIGISKEHEGFRNTKSISKKQFQSQLELILSNYPEDTRFIIINAHGGNVEILNSIKDLYKEKILVLNIFSLIKKDLLRIRTSKIGGICHAGEFETSIMLYLFPERVKIEKLKEEDIVYVPYLDPNYKNKRKKEWKTLKFSKSGILGDPFHASPEKGKLWLRSLIKEIQASIERFMNKYEYI